MTSPVVVPKPKRLLSPKTGFDLLEEKKQDSGEPSDKMFIFDSRLERPSTLALSGGVQQEASLEVERILLALEDSERDQKSPLLENPRDTYVQDSPPLRAISPPARSQNPQAETMEALWREQTEVVDSDECLPSAGQHVFDEFPDYEEDEMPAIEQFQFMTQRPSTTQRPPIQSFTEPSSPYSAPLMPLGFGIRRNSLSPGDDDDEQEDIDIVFISPPDIYGLEETSMIPEDTPEEDLPTEPGSCPLSIQVTGPPLSMRRFQSLPGSGPSSGPSSTTNSTKRKRGKPKYESRSLPITVGCDLVLTMQRRQVRTMSDTVRQSVAC